MRFLTGVKLIVGHIEVALCSDVPGKASRSFEAGLIRTVVQVVTQICNLLYRRFVIICNWLRSTKVDLSRGGAGRMQFCDTED